MTDAAIDWDALTHTEGASPWPAIDGAIAAIVAEPALWEQVAQIYEKSRALDEPTTFIELYAPIILGEAGARLAPGEPREKILDFLLDAMGDAYDEEDEISLMQIQHACGRMGPWILPALVRRLEDPDSGDRDVQDMWGLLHLACRQTDASIRERVARVCMNRLEEIAEDGLDIDDLFEPCTTLAAMKWTGAREIMERLDREKHAEIEEEFGPEFHGWLAAVRGDAQAAGDPPGCWWDHDLRDFLDTQRDIWESAMADDDSDEEAQDGPSIAEEEYREEGYDEARAKALAAQWGAAFAASDEARTLPPALDAADEASNLLDQGMAYFGMDVGEWDVGVWQELLLEIVPAKFTADADWFVQLAPFAAALLRWLDTAGIVPEGKKIARQVAQWGPEIVSRSNDPQHWGMAKSLMTEARREGVDLGNQEQWAAFIDRYNARLSAANDDPFSDPRPTPAQPYVREQPKVGRNDPCPCGSGKKYKKCCGT